MCNYVSLAKMFNETVQQEDLVFKPLMRTSALSKLRLKVVWSADLSQTVMSNTNANQRSIFHLVFRRSDYPFGV